MRFILKIIVFTFIMLRGTQHIVLHASTYVKFISLANIIIII